MRPRLNEPRRGDLAGRLTLKRLEKYEGCFSEQLKQPVSFELFTYPEHRNRPAWNELV